MNERHRNFSLLVCVTLAAAGLLLFPQQISESVSSSLTLCVETLLPTLFPFMILSTSSAKTSVLTPSFVRKILWCENIQNIMDKSLKLRFSTRLTSMSKQIKVLELVTVSGTKAYGKMYLYISSFLGFSLSLDKIKN